MKFTSFYKNDLEDTINNIPDFESLKNKRILVTGATGLIGSAIVDVLAYKNIKDKWNIHIYAAGRDKEKIAQKFEQIYQEDFFTFVPYDASKEIDFTFDVDYIIHAASNAHPTAYSEQPVETMISNLYGINNLLNYAKQHNVTRTLYISSSEVYGQKDNNLPYKENDYGFIDILNPRACYPLSKKAAETLCVSYKKEYGLDVVIVRPGHVYGPTMSDTDSRASAQFIRNVLNGQDIVMKSPGMQLRSYCYVFDCVSAILTVLLRGSSGEAYNISNKNSIVTIRQLAECLAELSGRKIIYENPQDKELQGYNMMTYSVLDSEKLEKLEWKGLYNLHEGVKRTLRILTE